jgi:hypothetical protein
MHSNFVSFRVHFIFMFVYRNGFVNNLLMFLLVSVLNAGNNKQLLLIKSHPRVRNNGEAVKIIKL